MALPQLPQVQCVVRGFDMYCSYQLQCDHPPLPVQYGSRFTDCWFVDSSCTVQVLYSSAALLYRYCSYDFLRLRDATVATFTHDLWDT